MGMPTSITLSSVGTSRAINLDWQSAKFTSFSVTGSSSGTFSYTVEGALDDLQLTPAANVAWLALSSGALTANSSINLFTGPLGGIRLNSTAVSSAQLVLRVLQGIGG
jgi:hypothetical protein